MIDPYNVDIDWSDDGLEEFLIQCICVCGKSAVQTAIKVDALLQDINPKHRKETHFHAILNHAYHYETLDAKLRKHKIGQYKRITKALAEVAYKFRSPGSLRSTTVADLESLPGIGPKTARYFGMYGLKIQGIAVIDTHILKFLRDMGIEKVPKSTPSSKRYLELERVFLEICEERGRTAADLDLAIWKAYTDGEPERVLV